MEKLTNETKNWKGVFPGIFLLMLETSFLGNILADKWVSRSTRGVLRSGREF